MKSAVLAYLVVLFPLDALRLQGQNLGAFYTVDRDESGAFWFRTPNGERFLSLGVSDVPPGPSREQYDPANPGYAAFRYYNSTDAWVQSVQNNLRQWGFNTIGAWGHGELVADDLPECHVLHWGSELGFPWCDLFADEFRESIEQLARRDIKSRNNDHRLIGWFTDNELQWYADTLFRYHLHFKQPSATRQKLLDFLTESYAGDFAALQKDFYPGKATSFEELGRRGPVFLKPGGNGLALINRFTFLIAEHYYRTVHDAIRLHDSHHLILGDRYMSYCPPMVAKAAGPYVDVISTNFDWPDWKTGRMPTHYLRMLHDQSGKPVLITEWYVAAEQNRSGNRNRGVYFTKVKTQDERAATAERRLLALMGEPYVVGAHWFRYADEPTNGRLADGEDFNFGLVDIHNRPYEQLVAGMQRANGRAETVHGASTTQSASRNLPVSRHSSPIDFPESLEHFTHIAAVGSSPLADLRVAWNVGELHLGLVGFRFVDQELFEDGKVPVSHHQRVTVRLADKKFDLTLDPHPSSGGQQLPLTMIETRHRHLGVRFTYLVRVSAADLNGGLKLSMGDEVPIDVTLHNPSGEATRWTASLSLEEEANRLAETAPTKSLPR